MAQIPKDPIMLLSYINTQLRNHYPTLEELCASLSLDKTLIVEKLSAINYIYDSVQNQFL